MEGAQKMFGKEDEVRWYEEVVKMKERYKENGEMGKM